MCLGYTFPKLCAGKCAILQYTLDNAIVTQIVALCSYFLVIKKIIIPQR